MAAKCRAPKKELTSAQAEKKIRKAAKEGKIEYAPVEGVESFDPDFVDAFLRDVCGVKSAWISDQSSLYDFMSFGGKYKDEELARAHAKILELYKVDVQGKHVLLDIFRAIYNQPKGLQ